MAFAAVHDRVPPLGWLAARANLFWVIAYDTEYAMVDRDDDSGIGIRTSALTFGRFDVLAVAVCYARLSGGHGVDRLALQLRLALLRRTRASRLRSPAITSC